MVNKYIKMVVLAAFFNKKYSVLCVFINVKLFKITWLHVYDWLKRLKTPRSQGGIHTLLVLYTQLINIININIKYKYSYINKGVCRGGPDLGGIRRFDILFNKKGATWLM